MDHRCSLSDPWTTLTVWSSRETETHDDRPFHSRKKMALPLESDQNHRKADDCNPEQQQIVKKTHQTWGIPTHMHQLRERFCKRHQIQKTQTVLHVNLLATTFVYPKSLVDLGCLIPSVGLRLPHPLTPFSRTFSFPTLSDFSLRPPPSLEQLSLTFPCWTMLLNLNTFGTCCTQIYTAPVGSNVLLKWTCKSSKWWSLHPERMFNCPEEPIHLNSGIICDAENPCVSCETKLKKGCDSSSPEKKTKTEKIPAIKDTSTRKKGNTEHNKKRTVCPKLYTRMMAQAYMLTMAQEKNWSSRAAVDEQVAVQEEPLLACTSCFERDVQT